MLSDDAYDADREPERRRRRPARRGSGSRTSGARSSSTRCRPTASWCPIRRRSRERASGSRACPATCPTAAAPLVGRAADLASLVGSRPEASGRHDHAAPAGSARRASSTELGRLLAPEFLDGVAFVGMADVTEPEDFLPALAEALDVKEAEGRTLGEGIVSLIGDRQALLLLDNLEQVVDAAPDVAGLVESCPELRIADDQPDSAPDRRRAGVPAIARSGPTPPSRCSPSAPGATRSSFELTAENAGRSSSISAAGSTACRWRSSSPPPACGSCRPRRCSSGSTARSTSSRPAPATVPSGSRRCAPRSTGATRCSTRPSSGSSAAWPCSPEAARSPMSRPSARSQARPASTSSSRSSTRRSCRPTARAGGSGCCRRSREYARERLDAAGEATRDRAAARPPVRGSRARDPRRHRRRPLRSRPSSAASPRKATSRPRWTRSWRAAQAGDRDALEHGLQLCGDLWIYWHIRGKNLTARDYAAVVPRRRRRASADASAVRARCSPRGSASWMLGQFERADGEWAEAYAIADGSRRRPRALRRRVFLGRPRAARARSRAGLALGGARHRGEPGAGARLRR